MPRRESTKTVAPAALLAFVPCLPSIGAAQDPVAFRAGLDTVRQLVRAAKYSEASTSLRNLLERNEKLPHARGARAEILELHRSSAFGASYSSPRLAELVRGEIVSYSEKTHRIKLRYTRSSLDNFADPNKPKPKQIRKRPRGILPRFPEPKARDPQSRPFRPRIHPAVFKSYKVTVRGRAYDKTTLLTGINADDAFQIHVGRPPRRDYSSLGSYTYVPTTIVRNRGGKREILFQEEWKPKSKRKKKSSSKARRSSPPDGRWPMRDAAAYKIELDVRPQSLRLKINGKSVSQVRWRERVLGQFGIDDTSFSELEISGTVEPAWIQGLRDRHRHDAKLAFAKKLDATKSLPAWLFAVEKPNEEDMKTRWLPGNERPRDPEFVAECLKSLEKGNGLTVLLRLTASKKDRVPPLARAYLEAYAHLVLRNYEKAITQGEKVLAGDADFVNGHLIVGRAKLHLRRGASAESHFRRVVALKPKAPYAHADLVASLLRQDKIEAAGKALDAAAAAGIAHERLDAMRRRLSKIQNGPAFGKRFTVQTTHYEITSDIDAKACRDAGKILEAAFTYYRGLLGKVTEEEAQSRRFRVFLFSGERGYKEYLDGIDIDFPIHTAGLYAPDLSQLLIWNLSSRSEMLRTIRHEGFHQFFDLLVADSPRWLNEGLAEYFEAADGTGKPVPGRIQPRHLRTLSLVRPSARGSIKWFLRGTPREFYESASLNYAKGWALVHFLRRGQPKTRAVFDRLLRALVQGKSSQQALDEAFEGVDMDRFSGRFWEYVDRLQEKR